MGLPPSRSGGDETDRVEVSHTRRNKPPSGHPFCELNNVYNDMIDNKLDNDNTPLIIFTSSQEPSYAPVPF
jgi:hypothetical protein